MSKRVEGMWPCETGRSLSACFHNSQAETQLNTSSYRILQLETLAHIPRLLSFLSCRSDRICPESGLVTVCEAFSLRGRAQISLI